jgi:hypothetical protein
MGARFSLLKWGSPGTSTATAVPEPSPIGRHRRTIRKSQKARGKRLRTVAAVSSGGAFQMSSLKISVSTQPV